MYSDRGYNLEISRAKFCGDTGNSFELIETGAYGYYIFDVDSGKYIEYSTDAPSPYLGKFGELKYFGPTNYYHMVMVMILGL